MTAEQIPSRVMHINVPLSPDELRLLDATAESLHGLDKQRAFLLHRHLEPIECPACHGVITVRGAALLPDKPGSGDDDFDCPRCSTPLRYHLGLVGGEQWFTTQEPLVKGRD